MKFFELFRPIRKGNFGLTDEAVYKSIKHGGTFLPLYGGTEEHTLTDRFVSENGRTKEDEPITKFDGEGIILSLDGSSGSMTYAKGKSFALNHHAGFLQLRENAKERVDAEFFSLFYESQLREASISEGSKSLTKAILEDLDIDLPSIGVQREIMRRVRPILAERGALQRLLNQVTTLRKCALSVEHATYQGRNIPIADVLVPHGGNTGLTEREIYQHILEEGERYEVLSSSTEESTRLGEIPKCTIRGEPLKVVSNEQGIFVSRNGNYAGTVTFCEKGRYALTDHAYFLTLNPSCPYSVSLKWIVCQYRQMFFDYTSSTIGGNNATWNMTGFFERARIDIPSFREQSNIILLYDKLDAFERLVLDLISKVDQLFSKQVVGS